MDGSVLPCHLCDIMVISYSIFHEILIINFAACFTQGSRPWLHTNLVTRRKKVTSHFDDLQTCYFSTKQSQSWLEEEDSGTVIFSVITGGICGTVVACWTAGQVEQSILHQGHDS